MQSPLLQSERKALIFAISAVLCWSTVATAFKLALQQMSPATLLLWSTLVSTLVLAVALLLQGKLQKAITTLPEQFNRSLVLGLLNPVAYYIVLFAAYDRLPAQVAQPLNYTWAIVLAVMAVPLLGQKLKKADVAAMIIGYAGVVIIAMGGGLEDQPISLFGIFLALSSTFIWACYWIGNSKDQRDPVVGLFQNFLVALPFTFLVQFLFAAPYAFKLPTILYAVYIGIFEMGLTFVLWLYALRLTHHTSRISNLIFISPFLSLVFIYLLLGESIRFHTIIGLVLIVLALRLQHKQTQ